MAQKKGILLSRVSTYLQDLSQQTDAVKAEMLKDGYDEDHIIIIEDKESAVNLSEEERSGLNKMKHYIETDEVDAVYVFEISRLSRRPEVLYSIREYLLNKGIQLVCIKPYIKLLEADGSMSQTANIVFALFSAISEQEGYIRKERFARAKAKMRAEHKYTGGYIQYGYTFDKETKLFIPNEEQTEIVRWLFNSYAKGDISLDALAKKANQLGYFKYKQSSGQIRDILICESYIGKPAIRRYNKMQPSKIIYPAIISEELYNKVQSVLQEHKNNAKTSHKYIYYCKGLLVDPRCNRVLCGRRSSNTYFSQFHADDGALYSISCPIFLIDSLSLHLAKEYYSGYDSSAVENVIKSAQESIKEKDKIVSTSQKKLKDLEEQEQRIQRRIIEGKLDEALGDNMILEKRAAKEELQDLIESTKTEIINLECIVSASEFMGVEAIEVNSADEAIKLIHESISKIYVEKSMNGRGGTLTYNFKNGLVRKFRYMSDSHKVTENDQPVEYAYVEHV